MANAVISTAAAEVPTESVANLLRGRVRVLIQKGLGGHDKSRCTESALGTIVVHEGLLERKQFVASSERLDGGDRLILGFDGENRTGIHRLAVHEHSAGAALGPIAHPLGSGDCEMIAQRVKERDARLQLQGVFLAVNGERNRGFFRVHTP